MTTQSIHSAGIDADFGNLNPRAFLIGLDKASAKRPIITLHAVSKHAGDIDREAVLRHFAAAGVAVRCRVRRHKQKSLERARSLEKLLRPLAHQQVLCDPTGAIGRAQDLVRFARKLRKASAKKIVGIYWGSQWRTLHVVFDHRDFVNARKIKTADLRAAEDLVATTLRESTGAQTGDYIPTIRLGFEAPTVPVVAVDDASYFAPKGFMNWFTGHAKVSVVSAALGLGVAGAAVAADIDPVPSASGPAVSAPNAKLSVKGGVVDENNTDTDGTGTVAGSFLMPLGFRYGAQIDGVAGIRDDEFVGGAGLHLFWRDPEIGQIGPFGSFSVLERDNGLRDQNIGLAGVEGELYLDQLTAYAAVGGAFGKNIDDGFYGKVELLWYLSNDFLVRGGGEYTEEREGLGTVGVEFQPGLAGLPGLTTFAEGKFGANDFAKVVVGFRYYFGQSKSLKARHRQDDWALNTPELALDHPVAKQKSTPTAATPPSTTVAPTTPPPPTTTPPPTTPVP